jgi:hypothetical protein
VSSNFDYYPSSDTRLQLKRHTPRAQLGGLAWIESSATAQSEPAKALATASWSATRPTLDIEADWPDQYEYEALVFD